MHEIILGKYGAGKSLYGVTLVKDELLTTDRPIVTTLALHLDRLNEYIQQLDPDTDHHVLQRVLVIDKEQLRTFWRYRGVKAIGEYGQEPLILGPIFDIKDKESNTLVPKDATWEHVNQGVCYVLDEAPVAFKSREWTKTGPEFLDYMNQHRKLTDTVHTLARHSAMLDKQFRDSADRCVIMDNWYTKLVRGFTPPRKITISIFENCPPGQGEEPLMKQSMKIDPKGLASCYNTAAGLGVAGTNADKDKKSKGIPWWMIIPAGAAAGLVTWLGVSQLLKAGAGFAGPKITVSAVKSNAAPIVHSLMPGFGTVTLPTPAPAPALAAPAPAAPAPVSAPVAPAPLAPRLCKGWAWVNDRCFVALLDGRIMPTTNATPAYDNLLADGVTWSRTPPEHSPQLTASLKPRS